MVSRLQEGMLVGRYRLARPIAEGGMGAVWVARDERLDREVAVKLLPRHLVVDDSAERRFEREARAMARLQHPHVVSVFDVGTADPGTGETLPYLVMELIQGRSLERELERGPLSPKWAVRVMVQVVRALGAAHAAGVVHRDLKPSNIMIGDDGHVTVLDFGLARLVRPNGAAAETTLTTPGMVLGSCPYMAPEQAMGEEVGPPADVFSCGAVLYETLSGRRTFSGSTPVSVLHAVAQCEFEPLEAVCPEGVPPRLAAIVGCCLERDPDKRYRDGAELAEDLQSFLGRDELGPRDQPTVRISSRSQRAMVQRRTRRRANVAVGALMALAVGVALGFLGGLSGREPLRPDPGAWGLRELLDVSGGLYHVDWNPAGTGLLVEHERGRTVEVLAVAADTGRARVLTEGGGNDRPAWAVYSPDGKAVALSRVGDTATSLQVIPAAGGAPTTELANAQNARWLDSGRLVFSRAGEDGQELWTWDLDSGATELLRSPEADLWWWGALPRPGGGFALLGGGSDTGAGLYVAASAASAAEAWLGPGGRLHGASWHPNGRSLAASVDGDLVRVVPGRSDRVLSGIVGLSYPAFDRSGARMAVVRKEMSYDLLAVDPKDGGVACRLCGGRQQGWGSVSPTGTVAFRRSMVGGGRIIVVDPESGDERAVTEQPENAGCPSFSPDGRRVAYLARSDGEGVDLRVMPVEGGDSVTLAHDVESAEFVSWSPDGRWIAYAAGSPLMVWVVSSAGGDPRPVSPPGGDYPAWSPDGSWIAYVVWTDALQGEQGTWVVPPQGGTPRKISDLPTRVGWSRDGSRLRQLRREEDRLLVYEARAGEWDWRRLSTVKLDGPAPPHFEFMPLTVDSETGELLLNRRTSHSTLLVFDGLDPNRW